jgi:hypothetical protein
MQKYLSDMHRLASDKLSKPDYSKMTNEELRELLREKDLPVYGAKAELIARLKGGN